jgi:hypothetical protein
MKNFTSMINLRMKIILFIVLCFSLIIACSESALVIPEQTPTPIIKVVPPTITPVPRHGSI